MLPRQIGAARAAQRLRVVPWGSVRHYFYAYIRGYTTLLVLVLSYVTLSNLHYCSYVHNRSHNATCIIRVGLHHATIMKNTNIFSIHEVKRVYYSSNYQQVTSLGSIASLPSWQSGLTKYRIYANKHFSMRNFNDELHRINFINISIGNMK